jgi:hypothetical protein
MSGVSLAAYVRLWAWAAMLRPLKYVVAFDRLVQWAHRAPRRVRDRQGERALEAFLAGGGRFPRRAPGNCLERSLGLYRLLCESGASPDLAVGIRKRGEATIEGHVWVVVDGRPFGEPPGALDDYVILVRYDASASPFRIEGGDADLPRVSLMRGAVSSGPAPGRSGPAGSFGQD